MLYTYSLIFLAFISSFLYSSVRLAKNVRNLIFISIMLFIFFAVSLNRQNQDYENYVQIFENPSVYAEIGYVALVEGLKYIGFESHRGVLLCLAILLFYTFHRIYRYAPHFPYYLIFYLLFLFPVDLIQIRNTFSVLIALNLYLSFFERKTVSSGFWLAILFSFHYIGFVYLGLLVASFLAASRFGLVFIAISFLMATVLFYVASNYSDLITARTLSHYFTSGKFSSVIVWGVPVLLFIFFARCKFFLGEMLHHRSYVDIKGRAYDFSRYVYFIILSSVIFLPGLYFMHEFNRLYRFVFILIVIYFGVVSIYMRPVHRFYVFFVFLVVFSFFGIYYSRELDYDWVVFGI